MRLRDAPAGGLEPEGGAGAPAAEEEAPEVRPVPALPEEAGAHLGVLLAADHRRRRAGVGSEEQEGVVGGGAAEEATGDEVDGGQLDAAVGGVHLGEVRLRRVARRCQCPRVVAGVVGGGGDAVGDVLQRHAAEAFAVAQRWQPGRRPVRVHQRHQ